MALPESQGGIDYQDGGFSSGYGAYPVVGDLGEIAARLFSPVTHNREGNILFIESFESGVQPWNPTISGTGGEIIVSNQVYRSSGYSCKLKGGSDSGQQAYIFRRFPYPSLGRYGLELSWFPGSNTWIFGLILSRMDGTTEHQFYAFYNDVDGKLYVTLPGGSAVAFATDVDLTIGYYPMHTMKLVVDLENDEYVRFILNEQEYDISAYSAYTFANSDPPHLGIKAILYSVAGTNADCWIDDIILTQNEPEAR